MPALFLVRTYVCVLCPPAGHHHAGTRDSVLTQTVSQYLARCGRLRAPAE